MEREREKGKRERKREKEREGEKERKGEGTYFIELEYMTIALSRVLRAISNRRTYI